MNETFRPLSGVKVVDFSHVIAGPFSTLHLALMGADVLKIENPNGGDVMRRSDRGEAYASLNAGKRTLSLDVESPAGREEALALAAAADIFVDNLRPGVLDKHGLGYTAVKAVNPRIVYCTISGFGRQGEWGNRPAYDHVIQAATGMMYMAGTDSDGPIKAGWPVVDTAAGIIGAMAILAGLRERDRTGVGMLLDVSMTGSAMHLMYPQACTALTQGEPNQRVGNQAYSGSPAADIFQTSDGWIALGANNQKQVVHLLQALGLEHLARDPEIFKTPLDPEKPAAFVRADNPTLFKARLRETLLGKRAAEVEAAMNAASVPAARVRNIAEFAADAVAANALPTATLVDGETTVTTTGLGFRVIQ